MDEIEKLFKDISTDELIKAIDEIKEHGLIGGIRGDGLIQKYAAKYTEITGHLDAFVETSISIGILKEAAFRWHYNETNRIKIKFDPNWDKNR